MIKVFKKKVDSGIFKISLDEETLEISLTNQVCENKIQYHTTILTEDTLPQTIKLIPLCLQRLFQILQEVQNLKINWSEGIITFNYITKIGKMKIEKQIDITLRKQQITQNQQIKFLINILRQENHILQNQNIQLFKQVDKKKQKSKYNCQFQLKIGIFILIFFISYFLFQGNQNQYKINRKQQTKQNFILSYPYSQLFTFDQNIITYLGNFPSKNVQLLKNQQIKHNQTYNFKILLNKMQQDSILIGIVDKNQQHKQRSSFQSGNSIAFCSKTGKIYYKSQYHKSNQNSKFSIKFTGNSFKQSDTVLLKVNLSQGKIRWIVNGVTYGQIQLQYLKDQTIQYVPYVQFSTPFNSIQWIQ